MLRAGQVGLAELDLVNAAGSFVVRECGAGCRDQRRVIELDGDAQRFACRFGRRYARRARSSRPAARSGSRPASGPADPGAMSMASCRYSRIIGRSWCSVSALNTSACDRTAGGILRIEQGLDSRARLWNVSGFHQVAGAHERSANACRLVVRGGVRRTASAESTAAASGAPRLSRRLCRSFNDVRDLLVGRRRGKREVSCLLLEVVHELGRVQVHGPPACRTACRNRRPLRAADA